MVAVPGAIPVAKPLVPATSLTVATEIGDEVHDTEFVRFWVLPSANVPIALNCVLVCSATVALAGAIYLNPDYLCNKSYFVLDNDGVSMPRSVAQS